MNNYDPILKRINQEINLIESEILANQAFRLGIRILSVLVVVMTGWWLYK